MVDCRCQRCLELGISNLDAEITRRTEADPTFVCVDCGLAVFNAIGQVRERCLTCQWLADIPDAADREVMREVFNPRGIAEAGKGDRAPPG